MLGGFPPIFTPTVGGDSNASTTTDAGVKTKQVLDPEAPRDLPTPTVKTSSTEEAPNPGASLDEKFINWVENLLNSFGDGFSNLFSAKASFSSLIQETDITTGATSKEKEGKETIASKIGQ